MSTEALFVGIVAVVAALLVYAAIKAAPSGRRGLLAHLSIALAALVFSLGVPAILAARGLLDRYAPPPPGFILFGLLMLGTMVLAYSRIGTRLIARISLAALVGYQVFRVPLELVLHQL